LQLEDSFSVLFLIVIVFKPVNIRKAFNPTVTSIMLSIQFSGHSAFSNYITDKVRRMKEFNFYLVCSKYKISMNKRKNYDFINMK